MLLLWFCRPVVDLPVPRGSSAWVFLVSWSCFGVVGVAVVGACGAGGAGGAGVVVGGCGCCLLFLFFLHLHFFFFFLGGELLCATT